jgi:hypothetical protein
MHSLSERWTLWAHLSHDSNWSIESYIPIMTITHVEEMISLMHALPDKLITDCMLFLMKEHIKPIWEDEYNKQGGCFSYKITDKIVHCWRDVLYSTVGQTVSKDVEFMKQVCGISISPKKKFCILKVWMGNCVYQDPSRITILNSNGCIFKKH